MSTWKWSGTVQFGSSGQQILSGTGSPEGVVTATAGSIYQRIDGGANSSVYFKETASGNTGWSAAGSGGGGGGGGTWDAITSPLGNLSLAMGSFGSTFNYSFGAPFSLTSVSGVSSGDRSTYTGTIPGGASNGVVGQTVFISGFSNAQNNGLFFILSSTSTTITVINDAQSPESASGTGVFIGAWTLWNTTAATSTVNVPSPVINLLGNIWNTPGVSDPELWTIGTQFGGTSNAGLSFLTLTHRGDIANVGILNIVECHGGLSPAIWLTHASAGTLLEINGDISSNGAMAISAIGKSLVLTGTPGPSGAPGLSLVSEAASSTLVSQFGISLGTVSTPIVWSPASGSTNFIATQILSQCQQSAPCTGNFTAFLVNAAGNNGHFFGSKFIIADFTGDFGSAVCITQSGLSLQGSQSGNPFNGLITDSSGSTGTPGQVLQVSPVSLQTVWGQTNINTQTASYIAATTDANGLVPMNNASPVTFTVPANASVSLPIGTTLSIIQQGAGQVTLTPDIGVTINTPSSLTTRAQWSTISVVKIDTDVWVAGGDLT